VEQINRGSENPANAVKRPTASDLAESDGLTQAADCIILLHRDRKYNPDSLWGNTSELIISKQRNGPQGTTFALFAEEYVSFESVTVR
jgi:replicative DNA helicase